MEATRLRRIKGGQAYDQLFPPAQGSNQTVRRNASLDDTVKFIPKVVMENRYQTRDIARRLKGTSTYASCSNIWQFVYTHIQYRKDQEGYEQIRSPARTWHDRRQGVDCDCYSVFISSILANLGIPHLLRITKYRRDYFQHIYPVVPTSSGEIIIDCVTDQFDYEVPYTEKKDFPMDLQFLNGPDDSSRRYGNANNYPADFSIEGLGELGKFKLLHAINKFNPVTFLLRNGLLASMKLNISGVAEKLRWSYLTPEQAAAKGMPADKLAKLQKVRKSLENVFDKAGGKIQNLKKAILKGKGNKDHKVPISGLGYVDIEGLDELNMNTPLSQLLGDVYDDESEVRLAGFQGFGDLGEPSTAASIAAAAAIVLKYAGAIKKIGALFIKGKSETSTATDIDDKSDNTNVTKSSPGSGNNMVSPDPDNSASPVSTEAGARSPVRTAAAARFSTAAEDTPSAASAGESGADDATPAATSQSPSSSLTVPVLSPTGSKTAEIPTDPNTKQSFWQKNKSC